MVTKIEAARIATWAGIPVVLTSADQVAGRAGRRAGRHLVPSHRAPADPAALAGPCHATPRGVLQLDEGAVRAVVPAQGVAAAGRDHRVTGAFAAGEPVDLVGAGRRVVARGLVNYDSDELPRLLGRTTRELTAELGEGYDRKVVHRDALVVLTR